MIHSRQAGLGPGVGIGVGVDIKTPTPESESTPMKTLSTPQPCLTVYNDYGYMSKANKSKSLDRINSISETNAEVLTIESLVNSSSTQPFTKTNE